MLRDSLDEQRPTPPPKDAIYTKRLGSVVPDDADEESAVSYTPARTRRESFVLDDSLEADLEDGYHIDRSEKVSKRRWWDLWSIMTIRPRKSRVNEAEEDEGLLGNRGINGHANSRSLSSKPEKWKDMSTAQKLRSIVLFSVGIVFVGMFAWMFNALFIDKETSDPFANWGKPGTTSEGLSWYPTDFLRDVIPIPCHSHNDYWRKVPLFSALYAGCISVEADVWDYGGDVLFVGHNEASLTPNRTFQSLYINPLVKILEHQNPTTNFYHENDHGVFDTDHTQGLTLLVDVKTDGATTWPKVLEQLQPLRERGWLSYVDNDVLHKRQITVVGTGETPFDVLMRNTTYRDGFFDAPLVTMWKDPPESSSGLDSSPFLMPKASTAPKLQDSGQGSSGTSEDDDYSPSNSYYASTSFVQTISRAWFGRLNDKELYKLRGHIAGVHAKGLKVRFWDTPSWPRSRRDAIWRILIDEGVDILNVDDLDDAKKGIW